MSAPTQLERMLMRPDPLLTFRWVIENLPTVTYNGGSYSLDSSYVETCELPFNNVTSGGTFFGGGRTYYPEFHDVSAVSVNFYGDSKGNALKYLWAWKRAVKDFDTGLYGLPDEYKHTIKIQLLDPKGNIVLIGQLEGVWPADTQPISFDYSDGTGRIIHAQNFSVDNMRLLDNAGNPL